MHSSHCSTTSCITCCTSSELLHDSHPPLVRVPFVCTSVLHHCGCLPVHCTTALLMLCCCSLLPAALLHHATNTIPLLLCHACVPAPNIMFAVCCLYLHYTPCCTYCRVRLPRALFATLTLSVVSHACTARFSPALHGTLIRNIVPCAESQHYVSS